MKEFEITGFVGNIYGTFKQIANTAEEAVQMFKKKYPTDEVVVIMISTTGTY